jgi:hypothetical protein
MGSLSIAGTLKVASCGVAILGVVVWSGKGIDPEAGYLRETASEGPHDARVG